ncbi:hypothetical protein RND71_010505 [Anisodus tanguticus]|uniref:Uncharacterized protein n=1 Tax=Anisodus tanguticus TaxID=243964 RepID=A0AAE1SJV8_9SOLA|nr:hypothetical protein RND71_010505 [Anisodus tanguticus]
MEFVILFASQGRYLSRNLQQVIKNIIGRAIEAVAASKIDPYRHQAYAKGTKEVKRHQAYAKVTKEVKRHQAYAKVTKEVTTTTTPTEDTPVEVREENVTEATEPILLPTDAKTIPTTMPPVTEPVIIEDDNEATDEELLAKKPKTSTSTSLSS